MKYKHGNYRYSYREIESTRYNSAKTSVFRKNLKVIQDLTITGFQTRNLQQRIKHDKLKEPASFNAVRSFDVQKQVIAKSNLQIYETTTKHKNNLLKNSRDNCQTKCECN